jgi:D-inositol-3-phosphate glycosyltransferase
LAQPGTADAGGMNVYVRELAAALARSGVRCEVFTRRESPDQPESVWIEPGFRAHHISAGATAPLRKDELPELVGDWTVGVRRALSRLDAAGEGVDMVHANYWLSAVAGHSLKHALDMPLVTTFHTLDRVKTAAGEGEPEVAAIRLEGEQAAIGCSDALLASSEVEAAELVKLYGADPQRVQVVAPGVDTAYFSPGDQGQARRAVRLPEGVPIIVFVGRVQPLKGLACAVEALAVLAGHDGGAVPGRAAAAHLVVIGGPSGPRGDEEMQRACAVVQRHGLTDRVTLLPPQPHELLSTYYRAADVCIVPSRSESFGLVALEAAACGIPVVASAVGGLTRLVDHGRTGYLVPAGDARGFAHFLGEVLSDRSLARALGEAAHRRSAGYTWRAAAQKVSALCDVLAGRELVSCQ